MKIIYPVNIRFPMERANSIQITKTCHALAELGHDVHLIVRRMSPMSTGKCLEFYGLRPCARLRVHRVPVLNAHGSPFLWNKSFFLTAGTMVLLLAAAMRRSILYARELGLIHAFLLLKKLTAGALSETTIVYECHALEHLVKRFYDTLMTDKGNLQAKEEEYLLERERKCFRACDGIVTTTQALRDKVREIALETPVAAIADGTDLLAEVPPLSVRKPHVVYAGQLYPWKGVRVLIRALQHAPDVRAVLLGGLPYERDMEESKGLAEDIGVADRVAFKGFVKPAQVREFLVGARVGVLPLTDNVFSRYFTSPLKLFEYMAAGLVVVASDVPTVREVLEHERNALLFPPGDEHELAKALQRALADDALAERLRTNAMRDVRSYSWRSRAERIVEFLNQVSRSS